MARVICNYCGKIYYRENGRVNEAKKFGWNQYCSRKCQDQAKITKVEKICANPNCNKRVSRKLSQFRKSKSSRIFCSLSCAASFNNSEFPKRKAKIKICGYCKKEFKGEGEKYCSTECQHKAQIISKEELYKQIKDFYKRNKRIPLKREFPHYMAIRARFGTWNKAIEAAGLKPNPVMFAKKHVAFDGHKCDSFAEFVIDNWLYQNNIPHQVHVSYPNSKMSADFLVNGFRIEFIGLNGEVKKYDQLLKKKRNLAKKLGMKILEIYPKDLFPKNKLDRILPPLLAR